MNVNRIVPLAAGALCLAAAAPLAAQDTLSLVRAQRLAADADPRAVQAAIARQQSALRVSDLSREWLPSLTGVASGSYLSDVARVDGLPAGVVAGPLQHQYDAYVSARQLLFDPTRAARRGTEDAQLAEAEAAVASRLWQRRTAVSEFFYAALRADAQRAAADAVIDDLSERLRVARDRVDAGVALPSAALVLQAELATREQLRVDAIAQGRAAREILGQLVGSPIGERTVLVPPPTGGTLPAPDGSRPEFAQLAASRDVLAQRLRAIGAQQLPRVVAVGRGGYGRPGLNPLGRDFDSYYTVGLQVEWAPFTWGANARQREQQRLQQQVVASEEAAFAQSLERAATAERAQVESLRAGLETDRTIIALREAVLQETRSRYDEGELTAVDYVQRLTELVTARLEHDLRRLRLAEAESRYFLTIGHEIR